jgi:hypothetical protein
MQYRLSTLFLIFVVVAATLALFGEMGLWISPIILLIAFFMNHVKKQVTLFELLVVIAVGGLLIGSLPPRSYSSSRESQRIRQCVDNLKKIGRALHHYHDDHSYFPMASIKDNRGQALHSWRVEILPELGYSSLYSKLKKDEPWDNPYNLRLLDQLKTTNGDCSISEYFCPSAYEKNASNYAAISGPGTAWRENKSVQLSDLPDGGRHTVMVMEVLMNSKHWAEPENITVAKILELSRTTDGFIDLCNHPLYSHVLFADGSVWRVPRDMPIPLWEKLLAGDVKSVVDLKSGLDKSLSDLAAVSFDASANSDFIQCESPTVAPSLYALPVWLVSVILLFRRAFQSRKPGNAGKIKEISPPTGVT